MNYALVATDRYPLLNGLITWTIHADGSAFMRVTANVREDMPYLPRFGLEIRMPEGYDEVEYYGFGPQESYVDRHHSVRKGLFRTRVDEMFENYVMPQENGSHYGTKWVSIMNELGFGIRFSGTNPFSFNASHYTPNDLELAKHTYELNRQKDTIVQIDYMMSGVGSASCGPELREAYRLKEKQILFELRPIFGEDE